MFYGNWFMVFQEENICMFENSNKQEEFLVRLQDFLFQQEYKGVVILCGNFLLWVNSLWECIPCIPEMYEKNSRGDKDSLSLCEKMDEEYFNTKFSLFSLLMGLDLFSFLEKNSSIFPQLLLSVDDKYVTSEDSSKFFAKNFDAIPQIYLEKLLFLFPSDVLLKKHLSNITWILYDHKHEKSYNQYLLSEKYFVRRFKARRESKTIYGEYNDFYHSLWANFKTCSLEIFHLLTMLYQNKIKIFPSLNDSSKIAVLLFIPDACTSSALQWGLAVSKTAPDFDIVNITQNTTMWEDLLMVTHISQWWIHKL